MRTLMAWDDATEAELLGLYLTMGENEGAVALTREDLLAQARKGPWDTVLLSLTFPKTADEGFAMFRELQELMPHVPVVLACRPTEMFSLPRFLTHGLRFYLMRDGQGDFVFLVLSSLESAIAATRAEESRKLADRLREEMDGVRRLQESIIPQGLAQPPGYRITARYEPAQMTVVGEMPVVLAGGDYYDIFRPDDRTLIVLVGDASGHGLKACMSIMAMHTLIRMFSGDHYRSTAAFVTEINQRLCENSIVQSGGGFITLFYAAIDTETHIMSWTSAGHPFALLQRMQTNEVEQIGTENDGGLPLGITSGIEYTSGSCFIPPGSRVLLYTDGLTDAFPVEKKGFTAFGVRGVVEGLKASKDQPIAKALDHLFEASQAMTGGTGRHDDTSVVLFERLES